jgi:hypothetical protein
MTLPRIHINRLLHEAGGKDRREQLNGLGHCAFIRSLLQKTQRLYELRVSNWTQRSRNAGKKALDRDAALR